MLVLMTDLDAPVLQRMQEDREGVLPVTVCLDWRDTVGTVLSWS